MPVVLPVVISYGFRDEHGFAAVTLAGGALSGEMGWDAFSGKFALARA